MRNITIQNSISLILIQNLVTNHVLLHSSTEPLDCLGNENVLRDTEPHSLSKLVCSLLGLESVLTKVEFVRPPTVLDSFCTLYDVGSDHRLGSKYCTKILKLRHSVLEASATRQEISSCCSVAPFSSCLTEQSLAVLHIQVLAE